MPAAKDKGSILGAIARKGLTALHPLGALDGRAGKARATSMVGAAESAPHGEAGRSARRIGICSRFP